MICTEYILCYLSGTVGSHFVHNIVVVCMDYLYWQVWVSICLQQLLNNVLMFLHGLLHSEVLSTPTVCNCVGE